MAKLNVTINGNGLETIENRMYLSKVNVGGQVYYLKDEEVRAIVAGLKEGAFVDVFDGNINTDQDENNKGQLVTAEQVKSAIANLTGAMHFIGVKDKVPTDNTGYKAGDVILVGTKEYVFDEAKKWVELGDETEFVKKTFTIAGIDMQDSISASELAKALEDELVKDLKGTGTAQTISNLKARGDLSGTATIETTSTEVTSTGSYTPAGSITGSAISGGTITVSLKDATSTTAASLTTGDYTPAGSVVIEESVNGTQIKGTVSAPTITVTPTNATVDYVTVTNAGSDYAITNGNAEGTFASAGLQAAVDGNDTEMLVFSAAPTASVVYTAPVLSGSLPTFKTDNKLTYVSGIDKATASAPVFTGGKFGASFTGTLAKDVLVTGVSYVKQEINEHEFNPVDAELGFSGTVATLSVSGNYDKVNASAKVAVNGAQLTVEDINVAAQDVTISKKSA